MVKTLYHGSAEIVEKPIFGHGKKYNDYGLGFYCTESAEMASEWAVDFERDGYANRYELELDGLTVLDLGSADYTVLSWLSVLLENREFDTLSPLSSEAREYLLRHFKVDCSTCDIMIGYRADDSYFSFAQDFLSGAISLRQLNNALYLGKLGRQVVLKSALSFERVKFVGYEAVYSRNWYAKKMFRDKTARREYFDMENNRRQKGDIYITQILDEEMKKNDPRLR